MASLGNVIRLQEIRSKLSEELDRCLAFWLKHSHDDQHGGFFVCLGKDGQLYDDTKYGWMQGRQLWMYSKLYNEVERFHKPELLNAAIKGAEFMITHMKDPSTSRCLFATTRDGKGIKYQRSIFTECFYVMGMSELAKATKNQKYKDEALSVMSKIIHWVRVNDSELGRPILAGNSPVNSMAIPMMVMCLLLELASLDAYLADGYKEQQEWAIQQLQAHVQRDGTVVLENVSLDGKELPGCAGRQMIPGHAIEVGWFLLQHAISTDDSNLKKLAIENFIINPFKRGWDEEYGGLFYFLDADGLSPPQLEWNMKLWWPHNEAMIAFLMAYKETKDQTHLDEFVKVYDYSIKHFTDPSNGEWFGYLNQQGQVNNDFKGGAFKGCFHVPRCLMMCEIMLGDLI